MYTSDVGNLGTFLQQLTNVIGFYFRLPSNTLFVCVGRLNQTIIITEILSSYE